MFIPMGRQGWKILFILPELLGSRRLAGWVSKNCLTLNVALLLSRMTTSLTVSSKGQVTLRKELLAHLGIRPGQRLEVEVLPGGRLELHAAQATGEIDAVFGLLAGRTERRASLEEVAEAAAAGWAGQ